MIRVLAIPVIFEKSPFYSFAHIGRAHDSPACRRSVIALNSSDHEPVFAGAEASHSEPFRGRTDGVSAQVQIGTTDQPPTRFAAAEESRTARKRRCER